MAREKRWFRDYEIEEVSGGAIKTSTLRKDRYGAQLFPFHRINRSIFYDLSEVERVIERNRYGGKRAPAAQADQRGGQK